MPLGLIGAGVGGGEEGLGILVLLDSEAVRRAFRREERLSCGDFMGFGMDSGASDCDRVTVEARRALRRARRASSEDILYELCSKEMELVCYPQILGYQCFSTFNPHSCCIDALLGVIR